MLTFLAQLSRPFKGPVAPVAWLFAVFIAIGILGFLGWKNHIETGCPLKETPQEATQQPRTDQNHPGSGLTRVQIYGSHSSEQTKNSARPNDEATQAPRDLFCEATISDISLVLLTYYLFIVGTFQAVWLWKTVVAAQDSARSARYSLKFLERPWLYVEIEPRLIPINNPSEPAESPSIAFAQFYISNYGRGPATITTCKEICNFGSAPDDLLNEETRRGVISPGKRTGPHRISATFSLKDAGIVLDFAEPDDKVISYNPAIPDGQDLFFRIFLKYDGILVKNRKSAFCWRFDPRSSRWAIHDGPEFNRQT